MTDLSPKQRRVLLNHVTGLAPSEFEELIFLLGPQKGVIAPSPAPQRSRAIELIEWARGSTGCGIDALLSVLDEIAPLPDELKPKGSTEPTQPDKRQAPLSVPDSSLTVSSPLPLPANAASVQLFLAHASEDKAAVTELYNRLKQRGYKPWLDKMDLLPGQNWRNEIPKAIKQSQIFIACFSAHSVGKQGYVQREFKMALQELANKPPETIYLIPLRLNNCEIPDLRNDDYGVNLRDYHWLDYFEANGFERLELALQFQFGRIEHQGSPSSSTEQVPSIPAPPQPSSTPSPTPSRYQQLEAYMKQGQWKKADEETYRLMITTVGKKEGDWFTSQELLTFPCEDLLIIDELWVRHSNGKFGFSVQKQIYVECGAKLDGKYPGDEIWNKFGDRVGWRVRREWILYSDVTFNTTAPKGHLPTIRERPWIDGYGLLGSRVSSLASRLANCSR